MYLKVYINNAYIFKKSTMHFKNLAMINWGHDAQTTAFWNNFLIYFILARYRNHVNSELYICPVLLYLTLFYHCWKYNFFIIIIIMSFCKPSKWPRQTQTDMKLHATHYHYVWDCPTNKHFVSTDENQSDPFLATSFIPSHTH